MIGREAPSARLGRLARGSSATAVALGLLAAPPLFAAQPDIPLEKQSKDNPTMQFPMSQSIRDLGLSVPGDLNRDQQFREVFRLVLRRNEAVVLDLQSSVFDPKLQVLSATGEELAHDDDSGDDGRSSRLIFAPPAERSGTFYVVASSVDDRGGKFTLNATPRRAPSPLLVTEIVAGQEIKGRFGTASALNLDQQKIYARYWFEASAGERILIEARSAVSLELALLQGDQPITDGATGSKGASLYYPSATAGRHHIDVITTSDSTGDYRLLLKRLPKQSPPAEPQPLILDRPVGGAFTEDTPTLSSISNRPQAFFRLEGAAGDRIVVSAKVDNTDGSAGYDAPPVTLSAGADTPIGFAEVQKVTSAPGADTAQMTVTFTRGDLLLLRLAGRSGAISPYSVVARQAPPKTPAAMPNANSK